MTQAAGFLHRSNLPARRLKGKQLSSRNGYAMAEVTLAFAVLGIALAGLFPFVLTQLRLIRKLEIRYQGTVLHYLDRAHENSVQCLPNQSYPFQSYHAVPWKNPRMRALISGARITSDQDIASDNPPIDDYTSPKQGNKTRTPVTIYGFQIIYPATGGDPQISVDANGEAAP
jgi:hypothetical protein